MVKGSREEMEECHEGGRRTERMTVPNSAAEAPLASHCAQSVRPLPEEVSTDVWVERQRGQGQTGRSEGPWLWATNPLKKSLSPGRQVVCYSDALFSFNNLFFLSGCF